MSNYTKLTDFAAKDGLNTGDPAKIIKGAEHDDEYNAIQVANNSKADANDAALTGNTTAENIDVTGTLIVDGDDLTNITDEVITNASNIAANTLAIADNTSDIASLSLGTILPGGQENQTVRYTGTDYVASNILLNDGTNIAIAGNLDILGVYSGNGSLITDVDAAELVGTPGQVILDELAAQSGIIGIHSTDIGILQNDVNAIENTVMGKGSDEGDILVWNDTFNVYESSDALIFADGVGSFNKIGINNTSPNNQIEVFPDPNGTGDAATRIAVDAGKAASINMSLRTAPTTGQTIGRVQFQADNNAGGYASGCRIQGVADGDHTPGAAYPSMLQFHTTSTTTPTTRMTIDKDGIISGLWNSHGTSNPDSTIQVLTQAQYDALTPDADTLYIISG